MRSRRVPPGLAQVAGPLAFALGYFALSRLGLAFLSDGQVALLWPASGLALGVLVAVPRRAWPRYALAAFFANLAAQAWARGLDTPAVALAAVNACEGVLAAWTLQTIAPMRRRLTFESTREVAALVAAATLANAVTAILGAAVLTAAYDAPFRDAVAQWWLADGLGMLAVAPVAILLRWQRPVRTDAGAIVSVAAVWIVAALICWEPIADLSELLYRSRAILPLLLWVAVRYGARSAAIALVGVAAITTSATVAGFGPFLTDGGATDARALQGALAVAIVSTLFVATVVAERRRAEAELRTIFESSPAGKAVIDVDGSIVNANRALARLAGCTRERLCTMAPEQLVREQDRAGLVAAIADVCAGRHTAVELEAALVEIGGGETTVAIHVVPLDGEHGTVALLHVLDVSERKRFETELRHLADHDPLTGLLNRRRFELDVERQLTHAQRYRRPGAVIVLDVDRFKQINDTFGHSVGDRLILSVADALRTRLRASDTIARLGGDEFAVLLPEIDGAGVEAVARELVQAVAAHTTCVDGRVLPRVTISVGVATFGADAGLEREAIVVAADTAMYRAKEAGRNGYAIADADSGPATAATADVA
ncbi:MAG TPA: diguanylate cyclase [Conexibacter sp.]|nr:diguanylate cyclase [Conexibacter sp.]